MLEDLREALRRGALTAEGDSDSALRGAVQEALVHGSIGARIRA